MFRKLSIEEKSKRRGTLNKNSLFLTLYTPLWRRRGENLTPEEVWVEGNRLAALLREDSDVDVQIKAEQFFDDLCIAYEVFIAEDGSQVRRSQQQASHSAMMVTHTAFLLLLNVYDKAEGHPHYEILTHLKSIIWDVPDCRKLYEEIRDSEDEREGKGKFIEVADFIEEIAAQEEPLSQIQKEFACKKFEEFVKENRYCNLSTMLDNERTLSRINDNNGNCFQSELNLLREEINEVRDKSSNNNKLSDELLAQAIENCQQYFWGNSAYVVVFCLCRDDLKRNLSQTGFEKMVEKLPYTKQRDYKCPSGTIANAFSDNPICREDINEWENFDPLPRIIKLRDELRKELKL